MPVRLAVLIKRQLPGAFASFAWLNNRERVESKKWRRGAPLSSVGDRDFPQTVGAM